MKRRPQKTRPAAKAKPSRSRKAPKPVAPAVNTRADAPLYLVDAVVFAGAPKRGAEFGSGALSFVPQNQAVTFHGPGLPQIEGRKLERIFYRLMLVEKSRVIVERFNHFFATKPAVSRGVLCGRLVSFHPLSQLLSVRVSGRGAQFLEKI